MLLAFAPLIAYLIWKFSHLGLNFDIVETNYFGRGFLDFGSAYYNWAAAFHSMFVHIPERTAYFLTEFLGLIIGVVTCFTCIKYYPEIAFFSLAVLVISWGSGPAQGIIRYILGAPAVFVMLAQLGQEFRLRPGLDDCQYSSDGPAGDVVRLQFLGGLRATNSSLKKAVGVTIADCFLITNQFYTTKRPRSEKIPV